MSFKEQVRNEQIDWKLSTEFLEQEAKVAGTYWESSQNTFDFCISEKHSVQNLYGPVRQQLIEYFKNENIAWHNHKDKSKPSNHLVDSQIAFLNFMEPLQSKPEILLRCFQTAFPEATAMLETSPSRYIEYEVNGAENYLKEKVKKGEKRRRGEMSTNADGLVYLEMESGEKVGVLIEWKFTESYLPKNKRVSKHGTDRLEIYRHLLDSKDSPFVFESDSDYAMLFFDPLDQLMRLQLLATCMSKVNEGGMDRYMVLLLQHPGNHEFYRNQSKLLSTIDPDYRVFFRSFMKSPEDFEYLCWEKFFSPVLALESRACDQWQNFIKSRYLKGFFE